MTYTVADSSVAKKYAQAFITVFSSVLSHNELEKIEQARQFLHKHRQIMFFLSLPHMNQEQRNQMVQDLVNHFSLPECCKKLFLLLLVHNRSFLIPYVLWYIVQLYKQHTGMLDFTIISSYQLDAESLECIKKFLVSLTGKDIMYSNKVDSSLIAGVRLQSNEYVWEYSVRKQIQNIARGIKK